MGKKPLFIGGGVLAAALVVILILVFRPGGETPGGSDGPGETKEKPTGTFEKTGLLFQSGRSGKVVFVERLALSQPGKNAAWFTIRDGSKVDSDKHLNKIVQIKGKQYKGNDLLVESLAIDDRPMGETELLEAGRLLYRDGAYGMASALSERFAKEHDTSIHVLHVYQRWSLARREMRDYKGAIAVCERYLKTYPFERTGGESFKKRIASIRLNYIANPEWGIYRSRRARFDTMKPADLAKHLDVLGKAYAQTANIPGAKAERETLLRLLARAGDERFLADLAKNGDSHERLLAAQEIVNLKQTDTTRAAMMKALGDPDESLRLKAVEYLGEAKHAAAVSTMVTMLKGDRSLQVRAKAAEWLGHIGGAEAVAALKAALSVPQKEVRRGVIFGLARAGEKDALRNHRESDPDLTKLIEANVK